MRDILKKLGQLEETAPKTKKILKEGTESSTTTKPATLRDVFEAMAVGQKPMPVVSKQGDAQKTGAGFLNITDTSPTGQAMQKALGDLAAQGKAQIVIPNQPGQTPTSTVTQKNNQGATAQGGGAPNNLQQMEEEQLDELSSETLGSYVKQAASELPGMVAKSGSLHRAKKDTKLLNRLRGIDQAVDKMTNEMEEEQLDELSPKTLKSYAKSAGERYGSKEAGERVAGAVRAKLAKQGKLEEDKSAATFKKIDSFAIWHDSYLMRVSDEYDETEIDGKLVGVAQDRGGVYGLWYNKARFGTFSQTPFKSEEAYAESDPNYPYHNDYDDDLYEGAKVDRMVKHIEKSERKLGKSKEKASDIAWATANKRGMLDNKNKKKVKEADIPSSQGIDTRGAGLGAGRSATTLEGKKPDFLDLDKDGNKKESMKKATADKKKKKVDESMNHRISAARLEGKSHGLKGHAHCGKNFEDLEERKAYCEGYKDGLDECYGMGVYEAAPGMPAATVHGMADDAMDEGKLGKALTGAAMAATLAAGGTMAKGAYDYHKKDPATHMSQYDIDKMTGRDFTKEGEMDEGNAFTAGLARAKKGGKFSVGGKTFTDRTGYDAKIDEAIFNPAGKIATGLRDIKRTFTRNPHPAISAPGVMGAGAGAATGIAAAGTLGAAFLPIIGTGAALGYGMFKGGQLTAKVLNWLAQKFFGTTEEALDFAKAHLAAAGDGLSSFQYNGKTYKVSLTPKQAMELRNEISELEHDASNKRFDKIMAPDTAMGKIGAALKEDPVFEAWDRELSNLLNEGTEVNEGLSVSVSKGQQNAPDSVTITAQDAEADQLLQLVKHAGLGLFGDDHAEPSQAMSIQPSHGEPNEVGSGGAEIDVVDDSDGMLALMKKLGGVESSGDEGEEEHTCNECGMMECGCSGRSTTTSQDSDTTGNATVSEEELDEFLDISTTVANKGQGGDATGSSGGASSGALGGSSGVSGVGATGGASDATASNKNQQDAQAAAAARGSAGTGGSTITKEEESEDQMEYEVAEDNAPDSGAEDSVADEDAEAKEDGDLAGADSDDEEEMNEGFSFESIYRKLDAIAEGSGDKPKHPEHDKKDEKDYDDAEEEDEESEELNEWANNAGDKGTDAGFKRDIEFMTKVIAGGLNKPKSTGQTTVPVIAGQDERMHDNPSDWAALAGIKKA